MITPAYGITATERVLPRLALDFTTGVLDSRVTVTRALNTATRTNSSGYIESVNANLPRFDYDPVTLAPRGLLIEETRANILPRSEEFSDAVWGKIRSSVSADAITAPSNTLTADKIIENTDLNTHYVEIAATATATAHTYSVFLKAGERTWARLVVQDGAAYFNLSTGAVGTVSAGSVSLTAQNAVNFGNGWYRCTVVFTPPAGSIALQIRLATGNGTQSYQGDGTSGIYAWGAQLEAGAFATSYIPTTTTSLTRNADVVSMTGTNFSSWYNQSEGAFITEFTPDLTTKLDTRVISVNSPGQNDRVIDIYAEVTPVWYSYNGFASLFIGNFSVTSVPQKIATAYKSGDYGVAYNGGAATSNGTVGLNTPTQLEIGNIDGIRQLNGHMRKINYYPQRLINAELQAFSK